MRSSALEDEKFDPADDRSRDPEQGSGSLGFWRWLWSGSIVDQMARVFGGFTLIVLVLVAAGVAGTLRVDRKVESFAILSDVYVVSADVRLDLLIVRNGLSNPESGGTRITPSPEALSAIVQAHEKAGELVLLESYSDRRNQPMLAKNIAAFRKLEEELKPIMAAIEAGALSIRKRDEIVTQLEAKDLELLELRKETNQALYELSEQGMTEVHRLIALLLVVGVISTVLAFVGKHAVMRRVARPIALISDASERIAKGETSHTIPELARHDEIGKLARSLSVLREVQQRALAQAQRELEREKVIQQEREAQRAEQAEAMHALAQQFETTVGDVAREVANASAELAETASNLVQSVDSSSSRVEMASHRLEDATRGMTGAASASDQFALSISEVSSQALISSERARKAAEAATSADATISEMTQSADKISQIVEVIAAIAHRTNLLALNASIEAARSAEAGRGFAVVANEVKELAAQTRRETAQVEELITTMQNATGQSASALSTIAMEVIELETSAGAIASAVDQQASAGQDLARAIDLAATNTGQVNESFTDVTSLMSASMATSSQLRDSSERLNAQSERLREDVAKFLEQVRAA